MRRLASRSPVSGCWTNTPRSSRQFVTIHFSMSVRSRRLGPILGGTGCAGEPFNVRGWAGTPGGGANQPVAPRDRLVFVACGEQGQQAERGVAQPSVAVVPVTDATDLLGQGRGG